MKNGQKTILKNCYILMDDDENIMSLSEILVEAKRVQVKDSHIYSTNSYRTNRISGKADGMM